MVTGAQKRQAWILIQIPVSHLGISGWVTLTCWSFSCPMYNVGIKSPTLQCCGSYKQCHGREASST